MAAKTAAAQVYGLSARCICSRQAVHTESHTIAPRCAPPFKKLSHLQPTSCCRVGITMAEGRLSEGQGGALCVAGWARHGLRGSPIPVLRVARGKAGRSLSTRSERAGSPEPPPPLYSQLGGTPTRQTSARVSELSSSQAGACGPD